MADTVEANTLLRDAGMKVGFHIMPNLPGSTIDLDKKMFETICTDPRFIPDFLKIYPTLVTPGSEIEEHWKRGTYKPYDEEDMIDLVAYAKSLIPEYTRIQRIQRDIPAKLIVAGSRHSNFRQLAQNRLRATGRQCRCIRCRTTATRTAVRIPLCPTARSAARAAAPTACACAGACQPAQCNQASHSDDGNLCNGAESCSPLGVCGAGAPVQCGAPTQCAVPTSDPSTGGCLQVSLPNGTLCNDGKRNTTGDQCVSGVCRGTRIRGR